MKLSIRQTYTYGAALLLVLGAATGDDKWEKQYLEVIGIREGKLPRPRDYERVYWDLRAVDTRYESPVGEAVSLLDLMKEAGLAASELAKVPEAKANSDDLVRTEAVAINMVKGFYDDGRDGFTHQAPPRQGKGTRSAARLGIPPVQIQDHGAPGPVSWAA